MARRALVEVLGDAQSFVASLRESRGAIGTFKTDLTALNIDVRKSAEVQVQASVRRVARMRDEMVAMRELASSYRKGSQEQIAALELVARKQRQLSYLTTGSSIGAGGRSSGRLARDERETSGLLRGGLRGAGIGGFGLAALAGGSFFSSYLGVSEIKATIHAATTAAAVQKQLSVAITRTGEDAAAETPKINAWADAQSKFGMSADAAKSGLARLVELTGSTRKAMQGYTAALAISKATGKDFNAVSLAVGKALDGQTSALARYIGKIPKGTSDSELLSRVMQKYGGQALAATTAQQRFSAELHNSEVIIGAGLMPTVNRLLGEGARWLSQMNQSGRLQRDVNAAVKDGTAIVHDATAALRIMRDVVQTVDKVTGSFKNTLELLIGLKVGSKLLGWAGDVAAFRSRTALAAAEVGGLRGKLLALSSLPAISLPITLDVATIFAAKGDQGPGPPGDPFLGQYGSKQFPLLQAIGHGNLKGKVGQSLIASEYAAYRRGQMPAAQAEAFFRSHFKELQAAGIDVTQADLERSFTLASTTTSPSRADAVRRRRSTLPVRVSDASTPVGAAALSAMQRNQLALAAAGRTATQTDDLAALRQQRVLLAKAIATETQRLHEAPTAALAHKYAANLQNLLDKDASAFGQITSIEQAAAGKAKRGANAAARAQAAIAAANAREVADMTKLRAKMKLGLPGLLANAAAAVGTINQRHQLAALGLGPTGHGQSPLRESLKTELARTKSALTGTLLDTSKNTHLLNEIGDVLEGKFGKVTDKTKAAIRRLLDTMNSELKKGSSRNGYIAVSTRKLTAGLGLSLSQRLALESRYAQAEAHRGRVPVSGAALGQIVIDTVHVHGVTDPKQLIDKLQKQARRGSAQRRGAHPGLYLGAH